MKWDKIKPVLLVISTSILLVFTQLIFSVQYIIFKSTKDWHVNPILYCILRNFGVIPLLFVSTTLINGFKIKFHKFSDTPYFLLLGFFGSFVNPLTAILGVVNSSAGYASFFTPLIPILTTILSITLKIDKISFVKLWGWLKILGVLMSCIGAFVMVFNNLLGTKFTGSTLFATVLLITGVWSNAMYYLVSKIMFNRVKKLDPVVEQKMEISTLETVFIPTETNKETPQIPESIPETILQSNEDVVDPTLLNEPSDDLIEPPIKDDILKDAIEEIPEEMNLEELEPNVEEKLNKNPNEFSINNFESNYEEKVQDTISALIHHPKENPSMDIDYSPSDVNFWANMYAGIYFMVLLTYFIIRDRSIFLHIDMRFVIPLCYSIFMASGVGFTINLVSNKLMGPTFTCGFQSLMTPFTVILGYIIFDEHLVWYDYVGGVFIIMGLLTVTFSSYLENKK
jgi:drug/metabolite transporter (DMT)-like permease